MPVRTASRKPTLPKPSKSAADTRRILAKLAKQHPNADTELHFSNAYELLVATILSAQCTDERVNQVTPALFKRYPNAAALARATTAELEPQIQSTGFLPRQVPIARRHGDRSGRRARRRSARRRWRRSSSCPASAARPPTSSSATRSACPDCPSIATCCASRTASASPARRSRSRRAAALRRHAAGGLDADVRHADPPRPPHLQAATALREVRSSARTATYYRDRSMGAALKGARRREGAPMTRERFTRLVEEALAGDPARVSATR